MSHFDAEDYGGLPALHVAPHTYTVRATGATYELLVDEAGRDCIRCTVCQRVSYHPQDVAQFYCGACHRFHQEGG